MTDVPEFRRVRHTGRSVAASAYLLTLFTRVRRRGQPVEKVVVGPVGSPRESENKSKTLRIRRIRPPNRRYKRARRSFSTRWGILRTSPKRSSRKFVCKAKNPDSLLL